MAYDPGIQRMIDRSTKAVNAALHAAEMGTEDGMKSFASDFVDDMYDMLNHIGSGIQWPGLPNRSSAPGQAPSPQSETYRDSWDFRVGQIAGGWYADVGSPIEYGPYLEMGTRYMEPRPHLRPLVDRKKNELRSALAADILQRQRQALNGYKETITVLLGGRR